MGDYGKTSNPDMLAAKFRGGNTGGPSEEVARLVGSRFVNISEPEKKITFNAALVKRMTGNDTINARFCASVQDFYQYELPAKCQ